METNRTTEQLFSPKITQDSLAIKTSLQVTLNYHPIHVVKLKMHAEKHVFITLQQWIT